MSNVTFAGFPREGIQFLRDLEQNNEKEWFEANKQTYRDCLQTPAITLVETLGQRLEAHYPSIGYDTRTNGGSLMRIYRDTRFSADKSPYKTNVAMMFAPKGYKRMEAPGFGLQITPYVVELVAGSFSFNKPQLETYRDAVIDEKKGAALLTAVAAIRNEGDYTLSEPELKKTPRGYDADHPHAGWLKHKGLAVYSPKMSLDIAYTPELVDVVMTHFINMAPVQQWLADIFNI